MKIRGIIYVIVALTTLSSCHKRERRENPVYQELMDQIEEYQEAIDRLESAENNASDALAETPAMAITNKEVPAETSGVSDSKIYYYVVVGSFETLNQAQQFNNNGPADITFGNIYKATANGRTVYRVCSGCFTTLSEAQYKAKGEADLYKSCGREIDPWIWKSEGKGNCIERPIAANDEYLTGFCDLEK